MQYCCCNITVYVHTNFDKIHSIQQGFCAKSIVENDRLLLPSNPDIGVIMYKDNFYAFCNAQSAYDFASRPDFYIENVAERAKKSPELIQLLELHKQFAAITPYAKVRSKRCYTSVLLIIHIYHKFFRTLMLLFAFELCSLSTDLVSYDVPSFGEYMPGVSCKTIGFGF